MNRVSRLWLCSHPLPLAVLPQPPATHVAQQVTLETTVREPLAWVAGLVSALPVLSPVCIRPHLGKVFHAHAHTSSQTCSGVSRTQKPIAGEGASPSSSNTSRVVDNASLPFPDPVCHLLRRGRW